MWTGLFRRQTEHLNRLPLALDLFWSQRFNCHPVQTSACRRAEENLSPAAMLCNRWVVLTASPMAV